MGVLKPKSKGHTKAWLSFTPIQGAMLKRGSLEAQLKGPHRRARIINPNSDGHTKPWESLTPLKKPN